MSQSTDTRRIYTWMNVVPIHDPQLPIVLLRNIGHYIWRKERPGCPLPEIIAGRGTRHNGGWVSYCNTPYYMGEYRIVLAQGERTLMILLHELTHALRFPTHSRLFVKRYFGLLHKYAGVPHRLLSLKGI